jgi:hypothetical protein
MSGRQKSRGGKRGGASKSGSMAADIDDTAPVILQDRSSSPSPEPSIVPSPKLPKRSGESDEARRIEERDKSPEPDDDHEEHEDSLSGFRRKRRPHKAHGASTSVELTAEQARTDAIVSSFLLAAFNHISTTSCNSHFRSRVQKINCETRSIVHSF